MLKSKPPFNLEVMVDDDEYERLIKFNWYYNKGYAIRVSPRKDGGKIYKMHREILNCHAAIDHIDRNRLNNQKANLRPADYFINGGNRSLNKNNTSGFSGVYWHKNTKKWQVFVSRNNKIIYLGLFNDKDHAIKARLSFEGQMVADESSLQDQK